MNITHKSVYVSYPGSRGGPVPHRPVVRSVSAGERSIWSQICVTLPQILMSSMQDPGNNLRSPVQCANVVIFKLKMEKFKNAMPEH